MFVAKDFARLQLRFLAQAADMRECRRTCTFWRVSARKSNLEKNHLLRFRANIGTIPKTPKNMLTNFQLERLKLKQEGKLDIVEKLENRVHKLTDSNGALRPRPTYMYTALVHLSARRAKQCRFNFCNLNLVI